MLLSAAAGSSRRDAPASDCKPEGRAVAAATAAVRVTVQHDKRNRPVRLGVTVGQGSNCQWRFANSCTAASESVRRAGPPQQMLFSNSDSTGPSSGGSHNDLFFSSIRFLSNHFPKCPAFDIARIELIDRNMFENIFASTFPGISGSEPMCGSIDWLNNGTSSQTDCWEWQWSSNHEVGNEGEKFSHPSSCGSYQSESQNSL